MPFDAEIITERVTLSPGAWSRFAALRPRLRSNAERYWEDEKKPPVPPGSPYRERLTELRDFLKTVPDEQFSMVHWQDGAKRCIGGWADHYFEEARSHCGSAAYRGAFLGLGPSEAHALFCPPHYEEPNRYTKADAVAALDALIETGAPAWR